jgi:16S rRNA (cytosine1402-N4)-methyltransferase
MGREVVELLEPVPGGLVIDATVGGGGHSRLVLDARPDLRILGIDRDARAVVAARTALAPYGERARVEHGGFEDLGQIIRGIDVTDYGEGAIVGILFDLGVSSPQLDDVSRGFSYWGEAALDMRMDNSQELTAEIVVNTYDVDRLADVIAEYGEERFARAVAREIVAARPLRTTEDLVDAVKAAIPAPARRRGGHPARRTFQAIRMEVNRELQHLDAALDESVHLLTPGGRILVLSYHSLEDRMVKQRFVEWTDPAGDEPGRLPVPAHERNPLVRLLGRRGRTPSDAEVASNPRASSARLRAAEKLPIT